MTNCPYLCINKRQIGMRYELPNGKTITLSFEQWDNLTDEKVQEMMADDLGFFVSDPFTNLDYSYDREGKKIDTPEPDVEELSDAEIEAIRQQIEKDANT
jgi:hypothetical protein